MIPNSYSAALSFVQTHGYPFIFLIMVFEGPMITTAAAFMASLGYLNVFIILFLALLGDITGDLLFYGIGRFGRKSVIERYGHFMGITESRIKDLEGKLHRHFVKTFAFVKFAPLIVTPGLISMGILKVPIRRFIIYSAIITFPRSVFFTALGFYAGMATINISKYLNLAQYIPFVAIAVFLIIFFAYEKISHKIEGPVKLGKKKRN